MNAIIIAGETPARLREMIDFAQKNGCLDELGRSLCHLFHLLTAGMVEHKEGRLVDAPERNIVGQIRPDFAPLLTELGHLAQCQSGHIVRRQHRHSRRRLHLPRAHLTG